ncbi:MAG: EF-hand domain-containing protein [Proteobacteria bacterium]|nr:EF-hand domain-containing protein [Pseudomonadota bacterium]
MKPIVRYALLLSAVVIAAGGIVWSIFGKTDRIPATASIRTADTYTAVNARTARGSGGRFFAQYDLDHDGRITRDEFNKALSAQFAQSTGGAQTMTQAQYIAYRMTGLRPRSDQSFRRDDWNGDGKLSLDEYMAPERARFESADRDGTGSIRCTSRSSTSDDSSYGKGQSAEFGGRSSGSRAAICRYDDLNRDGVVTRAEFDQAMQQEFASAAKGGALNADQFYAILASHVHDSATRTFARLDVNQDGKLDLAEFSASELRYFMRLDRNSDGIVTRDELGARRRTASNSHRNPGEN